MAVNGVVQPLLTEQVAEEIRALLARRRISGRELARRMGASHSWVNFRLTGAQEITLNDLQRFAAILDVEVTDLLPRASEGRVITTAGTRVPNERWASKPPRPARPHRGADRPTHPSRPPSQRRPVLVTTHPRD